MNGTAPSKDEVAITAVDSENAPPIVVVPGQHEPSSSAAPSLFRLIVSHSRPNVVKPALAGVALAAPDKPTLTLFETVGNFGESTSAFTIGNDSESETVISAEEGVAATSDVHVMPTMPPSYSTVMKEMGPRPELLTRDVRSMEAHHLSPFRRIPPPPYAQVQPTWSHNSREISNSSSEQVMFGPEPIFIWCQRCATVVITVTRSERSRFTHFAALALCIFGCWPCAMLPYCMNACKNTYHYCPECNNLFGMYRPW